MIITVTLFIFDKVFCFFLDKLVCFYFLCWKRVLFTNVFGIT
jgi:hypothetical protein